jgi:hypothetical protein
MEVECIRVKLKPNALPLVEEWADRLNKEVGTVKQLLRNEGMALESVFLEETPEGKFLIYYLRSANLDKARKVSQASSHPLDIYHQEIMKKISDGGIRLKCLIDVS